MDPEEMRSHNISRLPELMVEHARHAREAMDTALAHRAQIIGHVESGRATEGQLEIAVLFGYAAALELALEMGGLDPDTARLMTVTVMDAVRDMEEINKTIERLAKAMEN